MSFSDPDRRTFGIDKQKESTMRVEQTENAVAVTMRVDASTTTIFAMLCDPASHVAMDGSGMLRSAPAGALSQVGERFSVEMTNDFMGEYEMTNEIIAFEPNRLIQWEPTLTRASRPEDRDGVGESARQRWGYVLTPVSDTVTDVTETFDCIDSDDWLKEATKGGELWIDAMTKTLNNIADQIEKTTQPR